MPCNRRDFFKQIAAVPALALAVPANNDDPLGVLVDTTLCVGCRKCEEACNKINEELPRQSPKSFEDQTVFAKRRRMDAGTFTVVNRYGNVFAKFQCMHCLQPACVSACIVGALSKEANGAVTYDSWKCIGCRYCMVACPFQVPAYEYHNALTPKVRKCIFCFEKRLAKGETPACVSACPMQVMTFGKRTDLIRQGETKIRENPDRYVQHLYGRDEVGGTAWMYLSSVPFDKIDLPTLGYHPVPGFTEPVQHLLFKWFLPPLALYAALAFVMRRQQQETPDAHA
jgi:Fe-S-cluster-containing dehydrogenase component